MIRQKNEILKRPAFQRVYVISWKEEGLVKIGISKNPRARCRGFRALIANLRLEYETEELYEAQQVEAATHRALAVVREHSELFRIPVELAVEEVRRHIEPHNIVSADWRSNYQPNYYDRIMKEREEKGW